MAYVDNLSARRTELSSAKRDLLQKRIRGELKSVAKTQPILPHPAQAPAELSFAQLRLWFLQQLPFRSPSLHPAKAALKATR